MIGILRRLFSRGSSDDGEEAPHPILKNLMSKEPIQKGFPLAREGYAAPGIRLETGDCDSRKTGSATLEGKRLGWREFIWSREMQADHCHWHSVRWRFYENGLVCFDAQMSNSSAGVDLGDLQGHRIELREQGGLLVGIWAAGFYVRRGRVPIGYQANIVDDHLPLKMHFKELRETQAGAWMRR